MTTGHDNDYTMNGVNDDLDDCPIDFDGCQVDFSLSVEQILHDISRDVCNRLDNLESKLSKLSNICNNLEQKVDVLTQHMTETQQGTNEECTKKKIVKDSMIVEEISEKISTSLASNLLDDSVFKLLYNGIEMGNNTKILTLNKEDDFPKGSWLGDEGNPEMRVRCRIHLKDMFLINTSNSTPEKMALNLLDYLFDKETLSTSNISGTGKHKKKQLDPLMICGIWCHLRHRFGISESTWYKIRQSLDSKCRSAFRRAKKLVQKSQLPDADFEMSSNVSTTSTVSNSFLDSDCDESNRNGTEGSLSEKSFPVHPTLSMINDFVPNETSESSEMVEVFEVTPEQIARLRDGGFQIWLDNSPVVTTDDLSS
ncbi:hypothetical protein CHUAL_008394 [Chamberlinius hualienensis]